MTHIANSDIIGNTKCRYNPLPHDADSDYKHPMQLRIKELRLAKKMTQRQIAERAGMSLSYFTEIENGKKQINANRMEAIAGALGVQPHEIILNSKNSAHEELLTYVPKLNEQQKKILLDLAKSLAESGDISGQ